MVIRGNKMSVFKPSILTLALLSAGVGSFSVYAAVETQKEKEEFLGFPNVQYFVGEFGWAFGLLLIGIYLTVRDVKIGSKLLFAQMFVNITIVAIALFFISYTFHYAQDFDKKIYVTANILLAIGICYGIYFIVNYLNKLTTNLKKTNKRLIDFIVFDTPQKIKSNEQDQYNKESIDLINEVSEQY